LCHIFYCIPGPRSVIPSEVEGSIY
jgi:hypothetical protein